MRKAPKKSDDELNLSGKRNMRNQPTKAEYKLWSMIKDKSLGVKFLREEKIQKGRNDIGYFADFVCYERGLIVEVDSFELADRANDTERNEYFDKLRFDVIRFKDKEVLSNPNEVLKTLKEATQSPHRLE